jgi:hypothetical protein
MEYQLTELQMWKTEQQSRPEILSSDATVSLELTGWICQNYEGRRHDDIENKLITAGLIFVQLKPEGKIIKEWVTAVSKLLHVGDEAIANQVWTKFGKNFKPSESAVVTFLHLYQEQSPHEAGVVALAEMLCAGLPGGANYDRPLGSGINEVPPGVVRRSDNWYYYAGKRRVGCVLANDVTMSGFRTKAFPEDFPEEMLGVLGFGLVESHFLSLYLKELSAGNTMGEPAEAVHKIRQINRASLSLRLALGNGQVSNRHGVQLWYDTIATGLQLEQRLSNLYKDVSSYTEVHQAELQARETLDQSRLLSLGTFFAGALGFATVIQTLNSSNSENAVPDVMKFWLKDPPLDLLVPMLVVGTLAVISQQSYQWLSRRIKRSPKS